MNTIEAATAAPTSPPVEQKFTASVQPTDEQAHAISLICNWLDGGQKTPQEFRFGGFAGTGKTTVIRLLRERLADTGLRTVVCAFTGKAVSVLNRKKVSAQTIHSLIYLCEIDPKTGEFYVERRARIEWNPDLIIVDEASMISTDIYKDLKSYGKKILFVGDPGQLEPVGDNPDLMRTTDFCLTRIHRQAEASPIIRLANSIRTGGMLKIQTDPNGLEVIKRGVKDDYAVMNVCDQIICAKNATRQIINNRIRSMRGLPPAKLAVGDRVICLRNNPQLQIFNGLILFVREIVNESQLSWFANCEDEVGNKHFKLPIWKDPFTRVIERPVPPTTSGYFDFGYAITCHKSQGSEWENVVVYDEWMPPTVWDMKRWRYTAFTRASKQLTILTKYG